MKWLTQIKSTQQSFTPKTGDIYININNKNLILNNLASKEFYWHIINSNKHIPSSIQKWSASYSTLTQDPNQEWKNLFNSVFKYSRETKLQSFQFKIMHRTIACRHWLSNIRIIDSNICLFCKNDPDTIQHFFLLCENVNFVWVAYNKWWYGLTKENIIDIAETNKLQQNILLGFPDHSDKTLVLNFCILLAKYYIYTIKINKCNNFFLPDYLILLKSKLKQEEYILKKNNKSHKFEKYSFILNSI